VGERGSLLLLSFVTANLLLRYNEIVTSVKHAFGQGNNKENIITNDSKSYLTKNTQCFRSDGLSGYYFSMFSVLFFSITPISIKRCNKETNCSESKTGGPPGPYPNFNRPPLLLKSL